MSYYSNRDSYNNNNSGSGYSSYSSSGQSGNYIPSSRRPDGTYREEIRVRPGFVPEAERQSYVPPAARSSYSSNYNQRSESQESLEDRVDSWADEDAPVTVECSKTTEIKEEAHVVEVEEKETVATAPVVTETATTENVTTEGTENETTSGTTPVREPRKPSQLATAIDTALDNLSIGSPSNSTDAPATRQIGRFAAQIANDEREGRTYRRYDNHNNSSNSGSGYYNRDRDGQSGSVGYNRPYNNWNRSGYGSGSSSYYKESTTEETNGTASNSSENRVENEFKTFLEQLTAFRREMALINAKLEYIRYVKSRDTRELNEVERERLATEGALVSRLDSIFESIDALSNK